MNTAATVQYNKRVNQTGVTLLELMFVLTIVSILGMISVPLYQGYAMRSKISGELPLLHSLKMHVSEHYTLNKEWPASNAQAGAKAPEFYKGEYLISAAVSNEPQAATITLTYDADELPVLRGTDTLIFYPVISTGSIQWKCNQGTIPSKYRPPNCR